MKSKILLPAAAALLVLTAAGCGPLSGLLAQDFDAGRYVRGILDCTYLGEYTDYMETTNATEEEAAASYEAGLETEAGYLASYLGFEDYFFSEEMDSGLRSEMIDFCRDAYQYSRYEVKETVKTETGFTVEIEIEPIDLFSSALDELNSYIAEVESGLEAGLFDGITDAEFYHTYARGMMDICQAHSEEPPFLEPVTLAVLVTQDEEGYYTIRDTDFQNIDEQIIYYP